VGLVFFSSVNARALTVNIACYQDYRPYSYVNDTGEIVGMLVDFWKLWGKKNDVEVVFKPGHLSQNLEQVKTGKADMMIGLFQSKERSEFLDFSTPFLDIQTNLYINDTLPADTIQDLGDIVLGVIENDYVVEYLSQHHPDIRIRTFPGSAEVVKQALDGKLSAYALDFPNAIFLLAEHDALTQFRRVETLYTETLRAAVKKGNKQLLVMINQGVKKITRKDIDTILNKWGISPPPPIVEYRNWIIGSVLLLLFICIAFIFYSMELKSRIRRLVTRNRPFREEEWLGLIKQGESDFIEFKSTMRWNRCFVLSF